MSDYGKVEEYRLEKHRRSQLQKVLVMLDTLEENCTFEGWEEVFLVEEHQWVFRQKEAILKWKEVLTGKNIDKKFYNFFRYKIEELYPEEILEEEEDEEDLSFHVYALRGEIGSGYKRYREAERRKKKRYAYLWFFVQIFISALLGYSKMKIEEGKENHKLIIEVFEDRMEDIRKNVTGKEIDHSPRFDCLKGVSLVGVTAKVSEDFDKFIINEITDFEELGETTGLDLEREDAFAFEIKMKERVHSFVVHLDEEELGLKENSRIFIYDGTYTEELKERHTTDWEGPVWYEMEDERRICPNPPLQDEEGRCVIIILK